MAERLIPARLGRAPDGTPYSDDYGDVYHSAAGGPGQAWHVFLEGNDLPRRWQGRKRFVILETGFGTGLNFLTTWQAWREHAPIDSRLHYLAVEKHPFQTADLAALHADWPQLAGLAGALRRDWPVLVPGHHRLELDGGRVWLTLILGDAEPCLNQLAARVDAFYLDGFAPQRNPDMWSAGLLRRLGRLAAPGATLATWTVAATVRDGLARAGFAVDRRPGFGAKRHMLVAVFPGGADCAGSPARDADRHALVLGAGLAGSACAYSLARRGWRVSLLERHPTAAREASGNLAGIVRPLLSLDDNIASRFTRAAFLHAVRIWEAFRSTGLGPGWQADGVLHIARDAAHAAQQRAIVARHAYPADYVRAVDQAEASDLAGWPLALGGWLFPSGGWARPPAVCAANLAAAGDGATQLFGVETARLARRGDQWQALDAAGRPLAEAPVLILAAGSQATSLAQAADLPLRRVRGQVSHIPAALLPTLKLALCRDGYVTPAVAGLVCAGASYNFDAEDAPRPDDDAGNLTRLGLILPGVADRLTPGEVTGRVGFRAVPPDRLPLVGALPDPDAERPAGEPRLADINRQPGLYGLLGLASRGLVWAQLGAELLAARLEAEPLPLARDLADAVDPARFLLRRWRRQP